MSKSGESRAGAAQQMAATLGTPDGRDIGYLDGGDRAGYPVIGLHGPPGCRLNRLIDDSVYFEAATDVEAILTAGAPGVRPPHMDPALR